MTSKLTKKSIVKTLARTQKSTLRFENDNNLFDIKKLITC